MAKSIGSAARQARTALGLTQEDAAERLDVSVEFYARIERGNSLPSVPTLARIAAVLGVSADALLGRAPFAPGASATWMQVAPPADTPEVRRVVRMLRRASPGSVRLVSMLLKEIDRRLQAVSAEPTEASDASNAKPSDDAADE
ncbi:helix-turn-helix transcriptional regulator [Haliangium ochraceum]|uniref:helix-turn-helix transcriptional regulator n=1 Tax=Haliangium ochraceum TaxID=80816 RepID=UPI00019BAC34|nr:helix-turn-helix transcriptional regulator [Haliangium ochraceum]